MTEAITSSLLFSTDELARKFVYEVTSTFGTPCLRLNYEVFFVAQNEHELREILSVGHQLGGY